ncbi:MAG: DUF222 domain-containing protein [Acidimicrobiales bacterium]
MSVEQYRSCTPDSRVEAIREMFALWNSVHAELMDLIAAADAEEDWREDGAVNVASWVVALGDCAPEKARAWHRVGAKLAELPCLRAAFCEGRLSWDQISVIVKFATPETDAGLAEELVGCSVHQLETMARSRRRVRRRDRADAQRHRRVRRRRSADLGGVHYSMFLPDEDAATVDVALERHANTAGPDAETGTWAPAESRHADAIVDWAANSLGADAHVDLATVVIHADADVLDAHLRDAGADEDSRGDEGCGVTADGEGSIPTEGVLRLLCDSRVEYVHHDTAGGVVGVVEATRTIPAWLRRVVEHRDLHCRFPGCKRRIRHIHHIEHWARGGTTDTDNLVGLCWHHHHLVHEGPADRGGPWTVSGDPNDSLVFSHPDGVRSFVSTARPERLDAVRHRKRRVEMRERKLRLHRGRDRAPSVRTA